MNLKEDLIKVNSILALKDFNNGSSRKLTYYDICVRNGGQKLSCAK